MNDSTYIFQPLCHEQDAPTSAHDILTFTGHGIDTCANGLRPEARPVGVGENSWLSSAIVLLLILIAFNFTYCRRLLALLPQDLFYGRRNSSHTFENRTSGEARVGFLAILMLCVSEGVLLMTAMNGTTPSSDITPQRLFNATLCYSGVALAYYLFQLGTYSIIGYVFTDRDSTRSWVRGFNASQVLLSMLLFIPALTSLFYPSGAYWTLWTAVACYSVSRVIFICKGVKIFFNNFPSLLYFILYLCALEIVPLLIIHQVLVRLWSDFL